MHALGSPAETVERKPRGMSAGERLIVSAFALSVAALFLELATASSLAAAAGLVLDTAILCLLIWEAAIEFRGAPYPFRYLRTHAASLLFLAALTLLFLESRFDLFLGGSAVRAAEPVAAFLRNAFLIAKIAARFRRLFSFMSRFAAHPAQTISFSFLMVILVGAIALMLPFSTADGRGLSLLNAAFTATSAVCVTGLVVVDTARDLSLPGQTIVLALIQIGGLGIMAFSFFALVALRKRMSVRDRLTVSYLIGEEDMTGLARGLRAIVAATFAIEGAGAALLFAAFSRRHGVGGEAAFKAVFHAVSAFCNAGFALYSDSLESFRADPLTTFAVAFLIILGGISFSVMRDAKAWVSSAARNLRGKRGGRRHIPSLNSKAVLFLTFTMLAAAFIGFYLLEHRRVMASYGLGEQYLAAFFQSATLRTAGFNSVPFGSLRDATLLFMIGFMFLGGASGSTAGGIKLNTLAAVAAYFGSFLRGERNARLGRYTLAPDKIGKAFLILTFGIVAVFSGTLALSLTEDAPFLPLLFEAVSAFGTVGLSTGLTPALSDAGKVVIMTLMFLGRLGPLTILAAASRKSERIGLEYPAGDLTIG